MIMPCVCGVEEGRRIPPRLQRRVRGTPLHAASQRQKVEGHQASMPHCTSAAGTGKPPSLPLGMATNACNIFSAFPLHHVERCPPWCHRLGVGLASDWYSETHTPHSALTYPCTPKPKSSSRVKPFLAVSTRIPPSLAAKGGIRKQTRGVRNVQLVRQPAWLTTAVVALGAGLAKMKTPPSTCASCWSNTSCPGCTMLPTSLQRPPGSRRMGRN